MRKVILVVLACLVVAGPVMAAGTVRDNCGCGLGTMLLNDKEPTLLVQMAATFLNAICANQTFAITSGTLEANPYTKVAANEETQKFIGANMDRLALDIASGSGDMLASLGDLMGVQPDGRDQFNARLQAGFDRIFPSEQVSASEVFANIQSVM